MVQPAKGVVHYKVKHSYIELAAMNLGRMITRYYGPDARLYGIPRGGVCAAYALKAHAEHNRFKLVDTPDDAQILVDDLVDTGATRQKFHASHEHKIFAVLFDKSPLERNHLCGLSMSADVGWLDFPWEANDHDC